MGFEVQGHLSLVAGVGDGIVLAVLWDVDIGILLAEIELAELRAFVEADEGFVQNGVAAGASLGQCNVQTAVVAARGMPRLLNVGEDHIARGVSFNHNALARRDGVVFVHVFRIHARARRVHPVVDDVHVGVEGVRIAHKVEAG